MTTTRERDAARWLELRRQLTAARLSRREVQKLGLLIGGGMLLGLGGRAARAQVRSLGDDDFASPPTTPWAQPLAIPPVAQPAAPFAPRGPHQHYARCPAQKYYVLTAKEQEHSFHPELPDARIWGYDGTVPGPTLDARYGEPIMVRFRNELPAAHTGFGVPQLITHLHNFHTASESDGGPWDWTDPGGYTDHHYCMMRAGFTIGETDPARGGIPMKHRDGWGGDKRESLTTLFFHYHRPEFTTAGIYKGLVGFFRLFDEMDTGDETTGWRLPSGPYDVPLAIADKRFDGGGNLFFDQLNLDGHLGDKTTVNGKIQPFFKVKRRKYRFRLLNNGPSRFYTFALRYLGAYQPFHQITHSGNLLPKPRTNLTRLEVQVAERSDIIIDFSRFPAGAQVYLCNIMEMHDGRRPERGETLNPDLVRNQLLRFDVEGPSVADPSRLPSAFRALPPVNLNEVAQTRVWEFGRKNGMWTVNDQIWDPDFDHSPEFLSNPQNPVRRNTAEIWVLRNPSGGWEHPVHIHFEEAQLLKVNGRSVASGDRARTDMYRLGRNGSVEMFMRFRDFPGDDAGAGRGRYVMHCHNTVHEDHAMMATWNIVP